MVSVLTASEGSGLDGMAQGLIRRYESAGVPAPQILYVDTGCCTVGDEQSKLKARFTGWPNVEIRLDIWHFMRRLACGVTTEAHQLYGVFMSRLSACIFEWDAGDLANLVAAKKAQLKGEGLTVLDKDAVMQHVRRDELSLHCRRRTRGVETTTRLIGNLITELSGPKGCDSLGQSHGRHLEKAREACTLHTRCPKYPIIHRDWLCQKRWRHFEEIQVCQRLYLVGIIPLAPKSFYTRLV